MRDGAGGARTYPTTGYRQLTPNLACVVALYVRTRGSAAERGQPPLRNILNVEQRNYLLLTKEIYLFTIYVNIIIYNIIMHLYYEQCFYIFK